MKKYINLATFYLIVGLLLGIFYREFTKFNEYTGVTALGKTHGHVLILGFIFFLVLMIIEKNFSISLIKGFKSWIIMYNISLIYTVGTLVARGVLEVLGKEFAGLSHIAGLGHAMLGISLIWFVIMCRKAVD